MSLDKAAERCINVLLELIQTKVNYVVQEAIIVIKVGSTWLSIPGRLLWGTITRNGCMSPVKYGCTPCYTCLHHA